MTLRYFTTLRTLVIITGISSLLMFSCDEFLPDQKPITKVESISPSENHFHINNSDKASTLQDVTSSRENAITQAVKKVSSAVVGITVTEIEESAQVEFDPYFGFYFNPNVQREFNFLGSGFIISEDGYMVTNEHLSSTRASSIKVTTSDGRMYNARLIDADPYTDLALLKIEADTTFNYITFGNSDEVSVGEWAIALGNPFGLFDDGQPTVTVGVISAVKRNFRPDPRDPRVYLDMLQTDAAINRGNSGGPLVNANGEVIGVNTFIFTGGTSQGSVGLGFAIPSNRVVKIMNKLAIEDEITLDFDPGFEIVSIDRNLARRYQLQSMQGLLVVGVNKDGPAYECGILPGDIIMKIGHEMVHGETHAWALLREYEEGEQMRLEILRNGKRYETDMHLRKRILSSD